MPQTTRTRVSEELIDNAKMGIGFVLVKVRDSNEGRKTKSGIIVGVNPDVNYGAGEDSHVADLAVITGEVVAVPKGLLYDADDINDSMEWDTEMELQVGDKVWYSFLDSLNCDELVTDKGKYKILSYENIWVAMRGDEVIPVNGYCLAEPLYKEKKSKFDLIDTKEYDLTRGIIRHLGKPNKSYLYEGFTDEIDLKEGDMVLFTERYMKHPIFLERKQYFAEFDGVFLRMQRRDCAMAKPYENG